MKTLFGNIEKIQENKQIVRAAELEESGAIKEYFVEVDYTVIETSMYNTDMQVTVHAVDEEEAIELAEAEVSESLCDNEEMDYVISSIIKVIEPEKEEDEKTINMFDVE